MRNDTQITVRLSVSGDDCPYSTDFVTYSQWDVVTADPRSSLVVHRYLYNIKWLSRPFNWTWVQGILDESIEEAVDEMPPFFLSSSVKFKKGGPPFEDATSIDGGFTLYIDQRTKN